MGPKLLFVAGMPAAGKSHFGEWLQGTHGYHHIDAEKLGAFTPLGLQDSWNLGASTQDFSRFSSMCLRLGRPVLVNWGFPPHCLALAIALVDSGFEQWWFDGDRVAARDAYVDAGRDPTLFDQQTSEIARHKGEILKLFDGRSIRVLDSLGERVDPAQIWRVITL